MTYVLGPDTSNVNGAVLNAAQAKQQGMSFAFSKVTQGTGFVDRLEVANHRAAVAAGLLAGVYHFGQRGTGAAEARFLIQTLKNEGIDINSVAVVYDCELQNSSTGPSINDVVAFGQTFKAAYPHHPLGLYTGAWYWKGHLGNPDLPATFDYLWDSNYVTGRGTPQQLLAKVTPGYWVPYGGQHASAIPRVRQFTSSSSVANIGTCDASVFFGSIDQLRAIVLPQSAPAPAPGPAPAPTPHPTPGYPVVSLLQRAAHVVADGHWGKITDDALIAIRGNHHDRAEQHAVGTPVDGVWGPISQQHYLQTVKAIQADLGVADDGNWGKVTDAAFIADRNRYYGK